VNDAKQTYIFQVGGIDVIEIPMSVILWPLIHNRGVVRNTENCDVHPSFPSQRLCESACFPIAVIDGQAFPPMENYGIITPFTRWLLAECCIRSEVVQGRWIFSQKAVKEAWQGQLQSLLKSVVPCQLPLTTAL
jgi:hypothetical protein